MPHTRRESPDGSGPVDRDRQVRLLGLGLLHGLLDAKTIAAVAEEPNPIETLQHRGLLDPVDVTALVRILESESSPSGQPASFWAGLEAPPPPASSGRGRQAPWDSLPAAGSPSDGSGRQVLRALTLPAWKHYRDLRFLAEGGMGRVFKAYDPSLKRAVALKFLRRDDPHMAARFVQEAQHQAMVEHPRICRVYEVGEWEGQSYIAMQYVEGETLDAAIPRLSLTEKVQVMEAVAEAIHTAHHARLIHRDLKPANIMVARRGDALEATILDFGLAKGLDAEGLTQHGLAMGSVHYMAPEQVRGHHDRINRRTDVYGLGATLHKALTGEAPFAAFEGIEVFRRTVETDVPPLQRLVPDLPGDLDTLTRKCLEKDPARRYDSALAVAEDLRRWREGEPILARKPTLPYLAQKWARRHKLVVAVAGVALLGLLVLGGLALGTASSAGARVRHAQHFGQEAERIEALLRYSHLLPPHDVRPELHQARTRMAALEQEARRAGRLATSPADYALGRGHLALGDHEQARERLEAAWSSGLHTPEVALALGRALAATYQRALDLARALPSKELREARERELARDLRDPALARLKEGASAALEAPAYHEALVAFMGGQWEMAQAKAREAVAATPWLFEAKRLEGEALLARARALQDPKAALPLLEQAEAVFREARQLGPSDPATALGLVQVLSERASLELTSGGRAEDVLARCRQAVAVARTLRPDEGRAPAHLARALILWADLRPPLEAATAGAYLEASKLSAEALALGPEDPAIQAIRIPILVIVATKYLRPRGLDPLSAYGEAQQLAREAQRRHPQEPLFTAILASTCMRRMTWEINAGTPPWATFEEGLTQALLLRNRFPDFIGGFQALASLWVERAEYERLHGLDPRPSVAAALEASAGARARGLRPRNPGWTEGDAHLIQGQYLLATQGSGEGDFIQSVEGYQRALKANPNLLQAHDSMAEAILGRAQERLERGQDPHPFLKEAEGHLTRVPGRPVSPGQTNHLRGMTALLRGRQRLAQGLDPSPDWRQAVAAFRAAAKTSGHAKAQAGEAEVWARAYRHRGRPQDRTQALAAARRAIEQDSQRAEAWLWIAVVEQEAARRGRREAEGPARAAWAKALAIDANLRRTALSLGMP